MARALIQGTRVAQIVAAGEEFPIAAPLEWVDAPDNITTKHIYENGAFIPPAPPPPRRSPAEEIDARIGGDPAFLALVTVLAAETGKTEAEMMAVIKAAAVRGEPPV